jgi:hypothetical protein
MKLLTSYPLVRTADLIFTAVKTSTLITITEKYLIKSTEGGTDIVISSFHSTVTASADAFLHSPHNTVTVLRLYTLTHVRVPELILHGAISRVTGDSQRRLQDNVRRFRDIAPETYFAHKSSSNTF